MKVRWFLVLLALLLPLAAQAQNVCVYMNAGATMVTGVASCDAPTVPPWTSIPTSDSRWTSYLGLQGIGNKVESLLAVGIAQTFTTTTAASDNYSTSANALQYYLNVYQDRVTINAAATFTVCTSPPAAMGIPCPANPNAAATGHSMAALAFKDLYANAKLYAAAVQAAYNTAVANGTAPVWPSNAYSSTH